MVELFPGLDAIVRTLMSAFDRVDVIALDEDHRLGSRWEWASRPLAIGRGTFERCGAVYDPCWKVESVFFLLGLAVALDGLLRLLGRGGLEFRLRG